MAKTKGKGTALQEEISAVYTAITNVISIEVSGEESETVQTRTLDGAVHSEMTQTGYASNPVITAEIYYDSGAATHAFLKTSLRTPVAVNFKVIDVATAPLTTIWSVTGIGFDENYSADDAVKATIKLQTSGNPT